MPPKRQLDSRDAGYDWLWYAGLLLLTFLVGCFDLTNWDIWWHLRTGQLIWQRGQIPRTDWFTYTNPDATWIDLHWGFQLFAAGLWAWGGSAALVLAKCVVGVFTIGICLTIGRRDWPKWQTIGLWLVPVLLFAWRYYVRPEMLTLLFLALTLAILHHVRRHPRLVWCLPAVQLLWVNVQGLFVLQFVVMGCFLADAAIRRVWRWGIAPQDNEPRLRWGPLLAATGLSLMASLANPYGWRGAALPIVLLERVRGSNRAFFIQFGSELKGFREFIHELGYAALLQHSSHLLMAVVLLAGAISFALLLARGRLSLYRLLLFAGFAYLTWQMRRNGALFAVVGGVVVRVNFGELLETANSRGQADRQSSQLLPWMVALLLAALIVSVPTGPFHQAFRRYPQRKFGFSQAAWYTHSAAQSLNRPGTPKYIFAAHLGDAAICEFHLGPDRRVFVDARLETNRRETFERYQAVLSQLLAGDPRVEQNLLADVPPNAGGNRELPALLIDRATLWRRPRMMNYLIGSGRWRCIHFEFDERALIADPRSINTTSVVFVAEEVARLHDLPAVDLTPLLQVMQAAQAVR